MPREVDAQSAESFDKGLIVHGRETDAFDAIDPVDEDEDADIDLPPLRAPRPYKRGTRQADLKNATGIGDPPWWASTDPQVWADQAPGVRQRGSRLKTPGQDHIVGMGGAL